MQVADRLHFPNVAVLCIFGALFLGTFILLTSRKPKSQTYHSVNHHWGDFLQRKARRDYETNGDALIRKGLNSTSSAFELVTPVGKRLIMRDRYAEEIRNDDRFLCFEAVKDMGLFDLRGFETTVAGGVHNKVLFPVANTINRELPQLTQPLSEEAADGLRNHWSENPDWHSINIHHTALTLLAQLSSRVFVGPEVSRNPEWHDITVNFTTKRLIALQDIQSWPRALHPIVHWFLPSCWEVRRQIERARAILAPILSFHKRNSAQYQEVPSDTPFSTIPLVDHHAASRKYDPIVTQMRLSDVSLHTTGDLLTKILTRICEDPDLIKDLRKELVSVLKDNGLTHGALQRLWLMESVMKEAQRLEPVTLISMFRLSKQEVVLQDGTTIPKNTYIAFSNDLRLDPTVYPEPEKFDGYRFLRMRNDPEKSRLSLFTKTTTEHLPFGHGNNACPGRFMVQHEVKILLSHILLKYDMKLVPEKYPAVQKYGLFLARDPEGMIAVKRRQEEICL